MSDQKIHDPYPGAVRAFNWSNSAVEDVVKAVAAYRQEQVGSETSERFELALTANVVNSLLLNVDENPKMLAAVAAMAIIKLEQERIGRA